MTFEDYIIQLINLKHEGSYWDFKRCWHGKKADLLHDIICMANNIENQDAYIIIGVDEDDDFSTHDVSADTNRKNTQNLVDFLRYVKFAGGIRPSVSVKTLHFGSDEIDIIVVRSDNNTPYYLSEQYNKRDGIVYANNIYTRVQDSNTPKDKSADIQHIEKLWRKRFGIDLSIKERYLILLEQIDEWELNISACRPSFHKIFPEFTIHVDDDTEREGWEPQSPFYPDPRMFFSPMKLMYHSTMIFETGLISCDGGRRYLPYADERTLDIDFKKDVLTKGNSNWGNLHYYFYDLTKLSGKLFNLLTEGTLNFFSRGGFGVNLYLIFSNDSEHSNFRDFAHRNYNCVDIKALRERHSHRLAQEYKGKKNESRILNLLIVSELYNYWSVAEVDCDLIPRKLL